MKTWPLKSLVLVLALLCSPWLAADIERRAIEVSQAALGNPVSNLALVTAEGKPVELARLLRQANRDQHDLHGLRALLQRDYPASEPGCSDRPRCAG
jgi:hypothetical protein